jgi:hypothetical protein
MSVKAFLAGLFGAKAGHKGLWDVLIVLVEGRNRVKLQEERDRATLQAIALLPPGSVLRESDCDWTREIRMPNALPAIRMNGSEPETEPESASPLGSQVEQSASAQIEAGPTAPDGTADGSSTAVPR